MSYRNEKMSIEQVPGEPIIILDLAEDFDFGADMDEGNQVAVQFLNSLPQPIFWVVDFRALERAGFTPNMDQLLFASSKVMDVWRHPKVRQVLWVTSSSVLQLAAPGFETEVFGNLSVRTFGTLDEALAYARSQR